MESLLQLRCDLVHGVGADHDEIRPCQLQSLCRISQHLRTFIPLTGCLILFDLRKIYAVEKNLC